MGTYPWQRRRVVDDLEQRVGAPWVAPCELRVPTISRLTAVDLKYAVLASYCGTLDGVAYGMGVTRGQAKQSIQKVAAKIPGTLPAMMKVIAWVRGASPEVLGVGMPHELIPEHLLRPEHRRQTPIAHGRPALVSYGP